MKKSFLSAVFLLASCLLHPVSSSAQSPVNVTATVTDPSGIPYANATVSILLLPVGGATVGGNQILTTNNGLLDSSGRLNVSLYKNSDISPGGSTWQFTICETPGIAPPLGTGGVCFSSAQTVSAAVDFSTQFQAAAKVLTSIPLPQNFPAGNIAFTGNNTHSGAESFCLLDGMYVAGSSCYATIQAAETAACAATPDGTVYIPATYAGTDTFTYTTSCSAGYPSVDDKRRSASSASAVYSITYPSTDNMSRSLPLGADMSIYTAGSSDHHLKHGLVAATTTVSLTIGANNNVLISSVTCPNCITALPFTGTANLYIGASLVIGRETANEENVSTGNWSIVDATHLNITCIKTHVGTTDVEQQMGATFFDGGSEFIINPKAPTQSAHGSAARYFDGNGNLVFFYPGNSSDPWPYNGLQIFPALTGAANSGVSSPADLLLRNSSASFCTRMVNSVGNGNIALFCDALVTITKNTSFFGGGNTIFYSDQGVTQQAQITGATGTASFNTFNPVSITVAALPAAAAGNKGWIKSVSDSTAVAAEGQTCVGGSTNTALAFSNGTVWKCF